MRPSLAPSDIVQTFALIIVLAAGGGACSPKERVRFQVTALYSDYQIQACPLTMTVLG